MRLCVWSVSVRENVCACMCLCVCLRACVCVLASVCYDSEKDYLFKGAIFVRGALQKREKLRASDRVFFLLLSFSFDVRNERLSNPLFRVFFFFIFSPLFILLPKIAGFICFSLKTLPFFFDSFAFLHLDCAFILSL